MEVYVLTNMGTYIHTYVAILKRSVYALFSDVFTHAQHDIWVYIFWFFIFIFLLLIEESRIRVQQKISFLLKLTVVLPMTF